jgi:hypothetical protein
MAERLEAGGELKVAHLDQFLGAERTLYIRLLSALERSLDQPRA